MAKSISLTLPRGVKRAFQAAFLHGPALAAEKEAKTLEASLSYDEKKEYEEWLRKPNRTPRDYKALLRKHVAGKLHRQAREKSAAQRTVEQLALGEEQTKAARTAKPQSRGNFDRLIADAKGELKKEFGSDAVWVED